MDSSIKYTLEVVKLVKQIYGINSEIYNAMQNGEKVSKLVKADIKKKSKARYQNYRRKKELFELIKNEEIKFEISQPELNLL